MQELTRLLEAALFSAARPLGIEEINSLAPHATPEEIRASLDELRDRYQNDGHGVELVQLGEGYQVMTRREFAEIIAAAQIIQRPRKLSAAAMETLAIIAYRQPVSRSEIEDIRGVAADGVLRMLQERGLIDIAGRSEALGRPLLYATTPAFLEMLGLRELTELPRAEELAIALRPPEPLEPLAPPRAAAS